LGGVNRHHVDHCRGFLWQVDMRRSQRHNFNCCMEASPHQILGWSYAERAYIYCGF
jgi:hypothetical protein